MRIKELTESVRALFKKHAQGKEEYVAFHAIAERAVMECVLGIASAIENFAIRELLGDLEKLTEGKVQVSFSADMRHLDQRRISVLMTFTVQI